MVEPNSDLAASAARVIPEAALRVTLSRCQLGYKHNPLRAPPWSLLSQRVADVERVIQLRGGAHDLDDAWPYACIVVNSLAHKILAANAGRQDPSAFVRRRLHRWAEEWTPRVGLHEIDRLTENALREAHWYGADTAAKLLRLTMSERMAARITTIGAIDADKAARAEMRKERHRDRQRVRDEQRRRAAGQKTREAFVSGSIAEACRQAGISRSTYYRRLLTGQPAPAACPAPKPVATCDRFSAQQYIRIDDGGQTTCATAPERAGGEHQVANTDDSVVCVWRPEHERVPRASLNLNQRREDLHSSMKRALGIPLAKPWAELPDVLQAWNRMVASPSSQRDLRYAFEDGELTLSRLAEGLVRNGAHQRFMIRERFRPARFAA